MQYITVDAVYYILQFTRNFAQNFVNGKCTLGVFIDLSKAFDTAITKPY